VLSGGELAADGGGEYHCQALARFLGSPESLIAESAHRRLYWNTAIYPPSGFRNWAVPEVLLSGIMPKLPNGEKSINNSHNTAQT